MITPQSVKERRQSILGFQGGGISDYDDHPEKRQFDLNVLYEDVLGLVSQLRYKNMQTPEKIDEIVKCSLAAMGW